MCWFVIYFIFTDFILFYLAVPVAWGNSQTRNRTHTTSVIWVLRCQILNLLHRKGTPNLNVLIFEIKSIVYYTRIYDERAILHKHFNTSASIFRDITKVKKIKLFFSFSYGLLIGKTKMKMKKNLQKCFSKPSVLGTHAYIHWVHLWNM